LREKADFLRRGVTDIERLIEETWRHAAMPEVDGR